MNQRKDLELQVRRGPTEPRTADIIFIHGLGGSSRMTWCKSRRLDTFWPREWLPKDEDLHHARIFTFGYNSQFRSSSQSSARGISDFSKNLLYDMIFARDLQGGYLHMGEVGSINWLSYVSCYHAHENFGAGSYNLCRSFHGRPCV